MSLMKTSPETNNIFKDNPEGLARWHFALHRENGNPYKNQKDLWQRYEQSYDNAELEQFKRSGGDD